MHSTVSLQIVRLRARDKRESILSFNWNNFHGLTRWSAVAMRYRVCVEFFFFFFFFLFLLTSTFRAKSIQGVIVKTAFFSILMGYNITWKILCWKQFLKLALIISSSIINFLREKKRKRKLTNSFLKEQNLYFMIKWIESWASNCCDSLIAFILSCSLRNIRKC